MGGFLTARPLAERQHGVLTASQLRRLGFSARQIDRRVRRGELRHLHRGVYLLGSIPLPFTAEAAAVLACGAKAVLSHLSAAFLYALLPRSGGPVHVTVAGRHRRGLEVTVHESTLHHWEIRERHGIPVTAPVRTLVDLAATGSEKDLHQSLAEAFALRLTTLPSLRRATKTYRARRGVARLAALLEGGGPRRTRSSPEQVLLTAIRQAGLPVPETNVRLGRWEVDFLWSQDGLVVEVDAYSTHSSPSAFERDRRKDAELRAGGLTVQRFSAERVRGELDDVVDWIAARLRR